jgi:hypothetical protein
MSKPAALLATGPLLQEGRPFPGVVTLPAAARAAAVGAAAAGAAVDAAMSTATTASGSALCCVL